MNTFEGKYIFCVKTVLSFPHVQKKVKHVREFVVSVCSFEEENFSSKSAVTS